MKKRYIFLIALGCVIAITAFFATAYLIDEIYVFRISRADQVWNTGDAAVTAVFDACAVDGEEESCVYYVKDGSYVLFEDDGNSVSAEHNYGESDTSLPFTYDELIENAKKYIYNEYSLTYHEYYNSELRKEDFYERFNFKDCKYYQVKLYDHKKYSSERVLVYEKIYAVISYDKKNVMLIIDQTEESGEYYILANGTMIDVAKEYVTKQHNS